jgi:hypothetical protein
MGALNFIPAELAALSISPREIVLPMEAALVAIDHLEAEGRLILGWEGWVKTADGRVGHGSAPQGTASLEDLSVEGAAELCRRTIREDAAAWYLEHAGTSEALYFCLTVRGQNER